MRNTKLIDWVSYFTVGTVVASSLWLLFTILRYISVYILAINFFLLVLICTVITFIADLFIKDKT